MNKKLILHALLFGKENFEYVINILRELSINLNYLSCYNTAFFQTYQFYFIN